MKRLRRTFAILWRALDLFNRTDGWAIASHVALTALLAMFPFLIFLTSVAAFFDQTELAETVVALLFATVPENIAAPIAREVNNVLLIPRGDLLTLGVALALWFASSGVEALRVGLNRAYSCEEQRSFVVLRLESIVFVFIGTIVLLTLGLFVVVVPVVWYAVADRIPVLHEFERSFDIVRYVVTLVILTIALVIAHLFLPSGRRRIRDVIPGIVVTVSAWVVGGVGFSTNLTNFANYASTYAGLAGAMTALVFLYLIAAILLFGASINAAKIDLYQGDQLLQHMAEGADHSVDAEADTADGGRSGAGPSRTGKAAAPS